MLYSCKSNFDGYEIGKMSVYFWKRYYVRLIINSIIINLLISTLILILCQNFLDSILFFAIFLIYSLIYYKVKLPEVVTMSMEKSIRKGKINPEMEIKFYTSYLLLKQSNEELKVDYTSFNKAIETDANFYLQYVKKRKKKILIIQKNNCELELIQFIRKTFRNIENHLGEKICFKRKKEIRNLKFVKIVMLLLLILSILSILGGLYTVGTYNELNNIYDSNFRKAAWLFWIWLLFPILSIIIGNIYQKRGVNCSKNITVGFIICVLLGSFSLLPYSSEDQYNDYEIIESYKQIMGVEIPNSGQLNVGNMKSFNVKNISDLTITIVTYHQEDTSILVSDIKNNKNWNLSTKLSSELEKLIPIIFTPNSDIYYLFYNKTLDEYNVVPIDLGNYEIFTIKYDICKKNLVIYSFNYKK